MIADRQTHALPTTEDSLDAFIIFLGKPDFRISFPQLLARVHEHFAAFFDAGEALPGIDPGPAGKPPAAFAERLRALGFKDIQHVAERLRAWNSGTVPALRAERARAILEPLLPHLLASLGRQAEPDRAFLHFDTLISRQRAGVQLLSLFLHNTALLDRLANVLGASPPSPNTSRKTPRPWKPCSPRHASPPRCRCCAAGCARPPPSKTPWA